MRRFILAIFGFLFVQLSVAGSGNPVGSGFNYQGQLVNNGQPATGDYDFIFSLYDIQEAGSSLSSVEYLNVTVVNGLFNIENLDFGSGLIDYDGEERWIEVEVTASSDSGNYTVLSPRTRISAVPYSVQAEHSYSSTYSSQAMSATLAIDAQQAQIADQLSPNGATNGQFLQFNGTEWVPATFSHLWGVNNEDDLFYTSGKVGIGEENPFAKLSVVSGNNISVADFIGPAAMRVMFREEEVIRGSIGSVDFNFNDNTAYSDDFNIAAVQDLLLIADRDIKLANSNSTQVIMKSDGKVGVGNLEPTSRLDVNSGVTESPIKLRVDGATKMYMRSDGQLGIGATNPFARVSINSDAGEDPLSISSDNSIKMVVEHNGDIKQPVSSKGVVKYMLELSCNEDAYGGSTIFKSYDGVLNGAFATVSDGDPGQTGICKITFPSSFNISSRFIVASANGRGNSGSGAKGAQCEASSSTTLQCFRYVTSTGLGATNGGRITVLIY